MRARTIVISLTSRLPRARAQPFRRAQFPNLGRLAKSYTEHDKVVEAIMRGHRSGATDAMRSHILTVREEYELYAVAVGPIPHCARHWPDCGQACADAQSQVRFVPTQRPLTASAEKMTRWAKPGIATPRFKFEWVGPSV